MEIISERALKIIAAHTAALNEFNRLKRIELSEKKNKASAWVRAKQLMEKTEWNNPSKVEQARLKNWVMYRQTSLPTERPNYLYDLNSIDPKFLIK